MSNRIRELICEINAAWKPEHFIYMQPGFDKEPTTQPIPAVFTDWSMGTEYWHRQVSSGDLQSLSKSFLATGANSRHEFRIIFETNAHCTLDDVSFKADDGFYAAIFSFEMFKDGRLYNPLTHNYPDSSDVIDTMESFLSEVLESLKAPPVEVTS